MFNLIGNVYHSGYYIGESLYNGTKKIVTKPFLIFQSRVNETLLRMQATYKGLSEKFIIPIQCAYDPKRIKQFTDKEEIELLNLIPLTDGFFKNLVEECKTSTIVKSINLNSSHVYDENVETLSQLQNLEKLDLSNCFMTDKAFEHIAKMSQLRSLSVAGCKNISLQGLEYLINMPNLKNLDLSNFSHLSGHALLIFSCRLNIESLDLSFISLSKAPLNEKLSQLRQLKLQNCHPISDEVMAFIARHPNLEHLYLNGSTITEEGLKHIAELTSLKILNLSGCKTLNAKGLKILSSLTELVSLSLRNCMAIDDQEFCHLNFQQLEMLDLRGTSVSFEVLKNLLPDLPKLKLLNVIGTKLTLEQILELQNSFPHLTIQESRSIFENYRRGLTDPNTYHKQIIALFSNCLFGYEMASMSVDDLLKMDWLMSTFTNQLDINNLYNQFRNEGILENVKDPLKSILTAIFQERREVTDFKENHKGWTNFTYLLASLTGLGFSYIGFELFQAYQHCEKTFSREICDLSNLSWSERQLCQDAEYANKLCRNHMASSVEEEVLQVLKLSLISLGLYVVVQGIIEFRSNNCAYLAHPEKVKEITKQKLYSLLPKLYAVEERFLWKKNKMDEEELFHFFLGIVN